jgi:Peptidase propeptide and YPEB domain
MDKKFIVYRSYVMLIVHFDNPNIHSIRACVFTMSCTKLLATMTIFAVLLTAVWALGGVMTKQNADAQMMSTNQTSMATGGNMTSGMFMKPGQNITSSINLMDIIHQAIGSKVNVSLSDAATTAEGSVGNNSHAVAAHIDDKNGYLVYNVMVIDPSMNLSKVIVDPGSGEVLLSEQISKEEHMMMHGMMGPGMMMGPPGGMMTMGGYPG